MSAVVIIICVLIISIACVLNVRAMFAHKAKILEIEQKKLNGDVCTHEYVLEDKYSHSRNNNVVAIIYVNKCVHCGILSKTHIGIDDT